MYFRVFPGKRDCFALLATTEKTSIELLRAFGPRNDQQKASLRARSFACEAVSFPVALGPLRHSVPRGDRKGGLAVTSRWVTARSYIRFRSSLLFPSLRGSTRLLRFARSDKVKGPLRGRSAFSEAVSLFNESRSAKRNPEQPGAHTPSFSTHRLNTGTGDLGWSQVREEKPQSLSFVLLPDPGAYSSPKVFHQALNQNQALPSQTRRSIASLWGIPSAKLLGYRKKAWR